MKKSDLGKTWTERIIGALKERLELKESIALGNKLGKFKMIAEDQLEGFFDLYSSDEIPKSNKLVLDHIVNAISRFYTKILTDGRQYEWMYIKEDIYTPKKYFGSYQYSFYKT